MLSFENTEVAFKSRSNSDLRRAYYLFKLIANNSLVYIGKKMSTFALRLNIPVGWAAKPTIYSYFVGGESIEECQKNVRILEKYKVKAILDYSVEGTESIEDINLAMEETIRTIFNAAKDPNIPFAVFKPTAFKIFFFISKATFKSTLDFKL